MTGWTPPAFPAQWRRTAQSSPWIGRREELAQLERVWAAVEDGSRQLVFVEGEAGAGKSRLVMQASWALHRQGVPVLVGACSSDFGLPFDPLVPPVRALLSAVDRGELLLADVESASAAEARRLLAVLTAGVSSEATTETFPAVALGAVVTAIASACTHGPLVIVLEDLHWAGESGLRALRYVVERTAELPVLFLATQRDAPPDASVRATVLSVELTRLPGVHRITLEGFDTEEVSTYLTALHAADAAILGGLAAELRHATGGNPFVLGEVVRELLRHGASAPLTTGDIVVPSSLRALVAERLDGLTSAERDVMARAAVIGETFGVDLISDSGWGRDRSTKKAYWALTVAAERGLIEAVPGAVGQYRFRHSLARQAVLEATDPYQRATLHAAVALALEARVDSTDSSLLPQLAHHFSMAVGLGFEERAADYFEQSGVLAAARLAHSDAAALFERAAELSRVGRRRDELLLRAVRSHIVAGHFRRVRVLGEALATRGEAGIRLEAAVVYEEASYLGLGAGRASEVLAAALADSDLPVADPLRVLAEASYGRALVLSGQFADGHRQLDRALSHARAHADDRLLLDVLLRSLTLAFRLSNEDDFVRMRHNQDLAHEVTARARLRGELRPLSIASQMRAFAAYAFGDPIELDRALDELLRTGRISNETFFRWRGTALMATRHLSRADLTSAGESLVEARRLAATLDLPDDAEGAWSLQSYMIRRECGRLEFARSALTSGQVPQNTWSPGLLALYTELRMDDHAKDLLRECVRHALPELRSYSTWPAALSFLVDAAVGLDDRPSAEALMPEIGLYAGRNLMTSEFLGAFGSAHRALAGLTAVLGRAGVEDHYAAALEMDTRMGSTLHVATTRAEWATWLRRTGAPRARVDEQATEAGALADRFGLVRVRRLLGSDPTRTPTPDGGLDGLTTRELEVVRLIGRGYSNREVATELFISEHTAANHVRSILMKTRSANRTAAARYAMRHGLLEDGSDDADL
ncbi:MAG TPA: AAA family ATPase [Microlunatus sp.]|nr:AAA family ATPase [Microlunatus sp.]